MLARTVMGEEFKLSWSTHLQLCENNKKDEELLQKKYLPHDLITLQILTKLPIKSLIRFKSVSKQWYFTISSPCFADTHLKSSNFYHPLLPTHCLFVQSGNNYFVFNYNGDDYASKGLFKLDNEFHGEKDCVFVVGSCNGLVCLVFLLGYMIIWNPIIKKCVNFSYPFAHIEEGSNSIGWGFGYASCSDDYKVVSLVESGKNKEIIVHVFSLRTQKWKQIHDEKLGQYVLGSGTRLMGVLIGETLYWTMEKKEGGYCQVILGFDLVLERFNKIHGLVPGNSYLTWVSFLSNMGGYLSMCRFTNRGDVSISMLKQHGQVEYIGLYRDWKLGTCCALVGFTSAGKFFILLGNQELGLVDPNSSAKKYTPLVTFEEEGKTYMMGFTPSLISPLAIANANQNVSH